MNKKHSVNEREKGSERKSLLHSCWIYSSVVYLVVFSSLSKYLIVSIYPLSSCLHTHSFRTIKCGIRAHTFIHNICQKSACSDYWICTMIVSLCLLNDDTINYHHVHAHTHHGSSKYYVRVCVCVCMKYSKPID